MNTAGVYAKAIVGALIAGLTTAGTALVDGSITGQEWIGIALAVLATSGAVGVVTNAPDPKATAKQKHDARAFHLAVTESVTGGVVAGLAQIGHTQTVATPPELTAAAGPDAVDPDAATPEQILASVAALPAEPAA